MIKRMLKQVRAKIKFNKNTQMGKDVYLSADANCWNTNGKREDIIIGQKSRIYCYLSALYGGKIRIGEYSYIGQATDIGAKESISIGKYAIISNHVHIYDNNNHPTSPAMRIKMSMNYENRALWSWQYADTKPIVIEDNVWIGEYSAILKGVTIGKGSIVAMHSVVTKDVPPYSIVAGNPAKVVKKLDCDEIL